MVKSIGDNVNIFEEAFEKFKFNILEDNKIKKKYHYILNAPTGPIDVYIGTETIEKDYPYPSEYRGKKLPIVGYYKLKKSMITHGKWDQCRYCNNAYRKKVKKKKGSIFRIDEILVDQYDRTGEAVLLEGHWVDSIGDDSHNRDSGDTVDFFDFDEWFEFLERDLKYYDYDYKVKVSFKRDQEKGEYVSIYYHSKHEDLPNGWKKSFEVSH